MYQRIRFLREKYNFSIYDISQKLNITSDLYMQYETGKKEVPIAILSKIARIYSTSIDYIIEDTNISTCHPKNDI